MRAWVELVGAAAILAAGAYVLLVATGSPWTCAADEVCATPTDGWEIWRLGFAMIAITTGSTLILTSLWPR